jgi:hypothetical protein
MVGPKGAIRMTKTEKIGPTKPRKGFAGVSATDRTRVIMLSQVVTIVALLLIWWVLRARRSDAAA